MTRVPGHAAPLRAAPGAGGPRVRVLAGEAVGTPSATGLVEIRLAPGERLPAHAHGGAEALVHVLAGTARVGLRGREEVLTGGAVAHVPAGEEVAVENAGAGTLRLLVAFSPAGFETRFLAWEPAGPPAPASGDEHALLDLTALPKPQRHRTVIAALEALDAGTALVIVNDHEPEPLRRQLERRYGPRLGWEVLERSEGRVAVALRLADAAGDGAEAAALALATARPGAA